MIFEIGRDALTPSIKDFSAALVTCLQMFQDFLITSHSLRVRLTREGKEFPLPPSSSGDLTNLSLLMFIEKLDLLLIAERCQQ